MKPVLLLDESLQINIYYSCEDADLEDNICVEIIESCPEEERIFLHDESHLYLTPAQAEELAGVLLEAMHKSREKKGSKK